MLKTKQDLIFFVGGIISIIGAISQILNYIYAPYIFSFGALFLIYLQFQAFIDSNDNKNFRQKRLIRMSFFSSLLLALAAYLMFKQLNSWVVAVLLYGLTQLFISFRMEQSEKN